MQSAFPPAIAVLAGGLATRLRPLTETIPKALVEVAGEPFLFHQLRQFQEQGFQKVVLCLGYLGEQVVAAVGGGEAFGLDVTCVDDGPTLKGTAGALLQALPHLGENFMVCYGDSYLPISFRAVHDAYITQEKPALMTVLKNQGRWDGSNVCYQEGCLLEYNKRNPSPEMQHIDYGLSMLSADLLSALPKDQPADLADLFHTLSLKGLLGSIEVTERFYEIGSPSGLKETEAYLSALPSC